MKILVFLLTLSAMVLGFRSANSQKKLYVPLRNYLKDSEARFDQIPEARRAQLSQTAKELSELLLDRPQLLYICTHNSRRSHIAQLFAQAAAVYYGLQIETYSAGTKETAFHANARAALARAGMAFHEETNALGVNPVWLVKMGANLSAIRSYSKTLADVELPKQDFVAFMVCDQANESCPVVQGASKRWVLSYNDPKVSDGTPAQDSVYDARCREIATEQLYLMREYVRTLER